MKWFAILIFAAILLQTEANKRRYDPEETCTVELNLSRRKMKAVINEENTREDHPKYGRFLICVFKRRGVINENGTINESGLRQFLEIIFFDHSDITETQKNAVQHVLQKCKDIQRDTPEKTAVRLKNCIARNVQEFESDF